MAEKTLRALIFRHGTTVLNESNAFRGMLDPELDDQGAVDAHKAAEFISRQHIERILCSPLLRAVQTAQILSGKIGGIHIDLRRELFPWQIAPLYGKDKDKFAAELDKYIDNPKKTPEHGESLSNFIERVGDFFEDQLRTPCLTAYVCHTSNIVALNDLINGQTAGRPESGEVVGPGGICAIYEAEGGWEIEPIFGQIREAEFGS